MKDIQAMTDALLALSSKLKGARSEAIIALSGDASDRQFYRVILQGHEVKSAILMLVTKNLGPLVSGVKRSQDLSFVEIGTFLKQHDISVVEIYVDATDQGAILVEDLGDQAIWQTIHHPEKFLQNGLKDPATHYFKQSIDLLLTLQALPSDRSCISFLRELGEHEYRTEAQRFIDYCLMPIGAEQKLISEVWTLISNISKELSVLPKVFTHRDFMPWNLHIAGETVKIIDFQDALMAAPLYDLIALLHDRDIDSALGIERVRELISYYRQRSGVNIEFKRAYNLTLLQRSLRLAGQFRMLSGEKNRLQYQGWVPGCLFRIGWCLRELGENALLAALSQIIQEVGQGAKSAWGSAAMFE